MTVGIQYYIINEYIHCTNRK